MVGDLEAVHVATPVVTHLPFAVAAARRGLHVLCEKPLAANLAEAQQIAAVIRHAGVVGAVGYELRLKETRLRLVECARDVMGHPRMVSVSLVFSDHAVHHLKAALAELGTQKPVVLYGGAVHEDNLDQLLSPREPRRRGRHKGDPRHCRLPAHRRPGSQPPGKR
ncbi:MAG TPA: Gfo/Idh/MocA family oxidoreductase [Acidimicrobiales bacterium]|nr:Gfo/Idh/MocA family oxidoreductase [Acidimicrobiales bacterium]